MRLASVVLVLTAVALQWYSHSGGLLTTYDSCAYLSAAESFKADFTFVSFDGQPYKYWPPLFPVVLSLFGGVWYWFQLLLTAWIGVLVVIQTRKIIEDPLLQLLCQASILVGVHLLLIGTFLWSELLFLVILIHFAMAVERKQFATAIILGFVLCLQRNAGLFFVIAAALWYWDMKKSFILFILGSSGFFAWNIYTSAPMENTYFQSIPHNVGMMSDAMIRSLAPLPGIVFIVVLIALAFMLRSDPKTRLIGIMMVVYLAGMCSLPQLDVFENDRFASVVIPFFMIVVFRAIEIAASKQTSTARKVLIIAVACWLAYPAARSLKNAPQWHKLSFTSYFCPDFNRNP